MRTRKAFALGALILALAGCGAPGEEERAPLLGRWDAVAMPEQFLELQPDGTFVYRYGPANSATFKRLQWRLDRIGEVTISMVGGGNATTCTYELIGPDSLSFDNGRGGPCLSDIANMALFFRRNPTATPTVLPPAPAPIP